jgi:hypothetical protein
MQVAPRPNTFLPFGSGVHACPGNELAKLEMLVLIHHLVTAYRCVRLSSHTDSLLSLWTRTYVRHIGWCHAAIGHHSAPLALASSHIMHDHPNLRYVCMRASNRSYMLLYISYTVGPSKCTSSASLGSIAVFLHGDCSPLLYYGRASSSASHHSYGNTLSCLLILH